MVVNSKYFLHRRSFFITTSCAAMLVHNTPFAYVPYHLTTLKREREFTLKRSERAGDRNVNAGVYFLNELSSLRITFGHRTLRKMTSCFFQNLSRCRRQINSCWGWRREKFISLHCHLVKNFMRAVPVF
jgi:hypothetical protein